MLTLEEATWNLDGALTSEKIPLYRRKQIRAAVRDVALATIQYLADWRAENELAVPIHGFSETEAEINRLFGKER